MSNIQKSMRDIAFDLLSKKKNPVTFEKLWREVSEILGLTHIFINILHSVFYSSKVKIRLI